MKIQVSNLILEVTRRCNMRCPHCLRGAAQKLDMTNEIIDKVLSQVSYISSITFTGGDPSLNVGAIEHFTDVCRSKKIAGRGYRIGPDDFYVVTNGKRNAKRLAMALVDLYDVCDVDINNEMTALCMSRDSFHEDIPVPGIFKALTFFRPDGHVFLGPDSSRNLINEGRAKNNDLGEREEKVSLFENTDGYSDDFLNISEELYIAANGNVISNCNISYKRVDAESFGNILTTPLADIIQQHTEKEEERKAA